jgi:hypothetical protein
MILYTMVIILIMQHKSCEMSDALYYQITFACPVGTNTK